MKHKHYDKIVAKADNMDLVVFCRDAYHVEEGWFETPNPPIQDEFDYYLCLPQHKEDCLAWLNGAILQELRNGAWSNFELYSENSDWYQDADFMDEKCTLRIRPNKVKRWIAVKHNGYVVPFLFPDKHVAECEVGRLMVNGFQFIEIEVEENK